MENKLEHRVKNVMSAVFDTPVNEIDGNASPDTIDSWDSMKQLNLVLALEEEFEIQFTDEQTEQMLNLSLIIEVIKESLGNN